MKPYLRAQQLLCSAKEQSSALLAVFMGMMLLLSPGATHACRLHQPLTEDDLLKAQTVFLGKAIDYRPVKQQIFDGKSKPEPLAPAEITFRVRKVLSGKDIPYHITVNWIHGLFGHPGSLASFKQRYGSLTKVGILFPETFPKICAMEARENVLGKPLGETMDCHSEFTGSAPSDMPWVLNKHCSGPYMFPADQGQ
jgi:hypothetical protein